MATRTLVPAAVVRTWAVENVPAVHAAAVAALPKDHTPEQADKARDKSVECLFGKGGSGIVRGRLSQPVREAYRKANKSKNYVEKDAEARTVTVSYRALDKAGRNRTAKSTMTHSEARALIGEPNGKGPLPKGRLVEALERAAGTFVEVEAEHAEPVTV